LSVDTSRNLDVRVAKLSAHIRQRFPLVDQQAGVGMPQNVQTDVRQPCFVEDACEDTRREGVPVERAAGGYSEVRSPGSAGYIAEWRRSACNTETGMSTVRSPAAVLGAVVWPR
jgi:hypothetical protein